MRQRAATLAVVTFFTLAFGIAGRMDKEDAQRADLRSDARQWATFEEDEPFWNCVTMGNYVCGGNELP